MHDNIIEDYKSPFFYRVKYISGAHAAKTTRQDYHNSLNLIFIFFIKGRGTIKIEGTSYDIHEGDVILLNPSERFLFNVDDNCFHERIVLFTNMKMFKAFPCDCSSVFSLFYKRTNGTGNQLSSKMVTKHGVDRLFFELVDIMREKSETSTPLSICKIVEILCTISKIITNVPATNMDYVSKNIVIDNALHYINENYTKDITIQDIAEHANVHKSYLSHKFKEQVGISLWTYLVLRRLYKFNSLIHENRSMENIAYDVGFKNYSNFFKLYKKYMGITPMEFKKQSLENNNTSGL